MGQAPPLALPVTFRAVLAWSAAQSHVRRGVGRGVKLMDSLWAPGENSKGISASAGGGAGSQGGWRRRYPGPPRACSHLGRSAVCAEATCARAEGGGVGRRRASVAARDQCAASAAGPASFGALQPRRPLAGL